MDEVLSLIEDIYRAGTEPEHWPHVLRRVADALGSIDATMGGATAAHAPLLISPRTDSDFLDSYASHYHARNPMISAVMRQPVGRVVKDAMVMPLHQLRKSEFFNDWCLPQKYLYGIGHNLAADEGWRATIMLTGQNAYESHHLDLYAVLAPHLARAFQINQVLHQAKATGDGLLAALEHIDRGALVVDGTGMVTSANQIADRIISASNGLIIEAGKLQCAVPRETDALSRLIASCARGGVEDSGGKLAVTRTEDRRPLALLCIPFPRTPYWPSFRQPAAIVFVTDPDVGRDRRGRDLQARFGLTPAEAAFAQEIVKADGRKSAAARRGISISTARSHLTSIFDKTGVRRQAELVRLLLGENDD